SVYVHFYTLSSLVLPPPSLLSLFLCFNDTPTTEIYTLSLHDALPIFQYSASFLITSLTSLRTIHQSCLVLAQRILMSLTCTQTRSEEHTSELQSRENLVCRLLLEKKKKKTKTTLLITSLEFHVYRHTA